jgi:hypothetical protein
MRQTYEARQALRAGTEAHHGKTRGVNPGPYPLTYRYGTGRPDVRLRIVAAPGGVAFVEAEPAMERK